MSMIVLLVLVIFSFRWTFARAVLLVCWIAIGCGPATSFWLDHIQLSAPVETKWLKKNAIVVLGAGTVKGPDQPVSDALFGNSRVLEGARLYGLCRKTGGECKVLLSGGDPAGNGKSEAEIMARDLRSIGVADADLILEDQSRNTFENAKFSSALLRKTSFDATWLVTSGFHIRRALFYFSHFGVAATPAPSDQIRAVRSWLPSALNFAYFDLCLHEWLGYWRYKLFGFSE